MSSHPVLKELETNNAGSVTAFKRELQKVRTGRASTGLIENLQVEYYGSKVPLLQLGQINTPDARSITIQIYDASAAHAVEKAIVTAELGFTPSREGSLIRISIPPLNEERRKEIVKALHKMAEDMRISIRNHRRDANEQIKKLEKDGEATKDDSKRMQDQVQKSTDQFIAQIDKLLAAKEAECLEV